MLCLGTAVVVIFRESVISQRETVKRVRVMMRKPARSRDGESERGEGEMLASCRPVIEDTCEIRC